jgi:hypothetical protein
MIRRAYLPLTLAGVLAFGMLRTSTAQDQRPGQRPPAGSGIFERFDKNHDGKLTRDA